VFGEAAAIFEVATNMSEMKTPGDTAANSCNKFVPSVEVEDNSNPNTIALFAHHSARSVASAIDRPSKHLRRNTAVCL
jgi:hypothetical protein